ncbi:MAG: RNA 3'-terminal phosphate cyclase [Chloroflexota bacterium]
MIHIDGASGEGGGQVLRSSLTLSILTGQPVRLENIRAGRSKPGLQAQHLQAVKAAAAVCDAQVEGHGLGSQALTFAPRNVRAGNYRFDINTAGAVTLVLQTIFLPLSVASGKSSVTIGGGTHVPWSPSFHYLDWLWLPCLQQLGYNAAFTLGQAGFYPQGGGQVRAVIHPASSLQPKDWSERGALVDIRGLSGVANLDEEIARRQKLQALRTLELRCRDAKIKTESVRSPGKGTYVTLLARFEHTQACFTALGAPGKRAERVADEAAADLEAFLDGEGAIDPHLADQILLPLVLCGGASQVTTTQVTQHLLTNAAVIERFDAAQIAIEGEIGQSGVVRIVSKL